MTHVENERLGVLEEKVSRIEGDVTDIKTNVQTLVLNAAARKAEEDLRNKNAAASATWIRFLTERTIAILALAVAAYSILRG